jgi:hypothetical protein
MDDVMALCQETSNAINQEDWLPLELQARTLGEENI